MSATPAQLDVPPLSARGGDAHDRRAAPAPPRESGSFFSRVVSDEWKLGVAIAAGVTLLTGTVIEWIIGSPAGALRPEGATGVVAAIAVFAHSLQWLSLALGAIHGVKIAAESVRKLKPSIDVLMVVGAALAAAIGHPEEGALLLFMFTLAGALEARANARAKDAVSRLHKLMPHEALRREGSDWQPVDPESLRAGDVVMIRAGESVPADATILTGKSDIDQSSLTGESLPRTVAEGDAIYAGTMNRQGVLEARVTRPVAESSLQKILRLVIEAQEQRQPMQRLIDKLSTPYTVTIFAVAIGFFAFLMLVQSATLTEATYRAITLLIVASPCALVIATPTATLCGLSRAARAGLLVKGGDALERLASVRAVAMDKTGTLTKGQIEVVHAEPVGASDEHRLLSLALGVEERSTHPIASAIVRSAREHGLRGTEVAQLTNVPGRGVEGVFHGKPVRIGTIEFCEPLIPVCFQKWTRDLVSRIRAEGGISAVVAHDDQALVLALADQPREGAAELAGRLREEGVERIAMLTGDHKIIAEKLARELGIDDVHADLLPEQKVDIVREIKEDLNNEKTKEPRGSARGSAENNPLAHARGSLESEPARQMTPRRGLAVIGDGVNDAPALAVADVGLAMGGIGSDAALETADIVLLHDDIRRVPWAIGLARRVRRTMLVNLSIALGVIGVLVILTLLGNLKLGFGVVGHEGSTLVVVANSLRILGHRKP